MAGLERKRFYCREWVFSKLAHCLEQRPASKTCGALVVGGAGAGKTALCSELVWPSSGSAARQQRALRRRLLAYHFCQSHNASSLSLANFVRSLVAQLMSHAKQPEAGDDAPAAGAPAAGAPAAGAASVTSSPSASAIPNLNLTRAAAEAYAERVRTDPEIQAALRADALERDPDEALKKAVLFPLLELEPPRQCVLLLVDSLDEGGPLTRDDGLPTAGTPSRTIGELLANHHHLFPQWLLLVVTARRHTKAAAKLFAGFKKISLDDMRKSQQVRDVQQYIIGRLDREDALKRSISRGETAETLNQLHIKCNGCFLYLEKVLDGVTENWITLPQIKEIPGTLNGLYLWLCQRLFRSKFSKVQILLNVLAVSQQPLTRGQLYDCVKTSSVTMMREDFNRRFQLLKEVLVPVKAVDANRDTEKNSHKSRRAASARIRFMFFHHSFAEWLVDVKHCTLKYLCNASEGHAMIAMWHTRRARKLTADEVQNLAYHLSRARVLPEKESPVASPADAQADVLDEDFIRLLWLIDSGAAVEDCLTLNGRDRLPFPVPVREDGTVTTDTPLSTPRDPKVLDLLVKAGAKLPMQEDDPGGGTEEKGRGGGEVEDGASEEVKKEEVLATEVEGSGGEATGAEATGAEAPVGEKPTEGLAEGVTEPNSGVVEADATSSQVSTEGSPDTGSLANLLGVDGDINQVDAASGRTLLHLFAAEGDLRLLNAALARRPEADLEHVDRHGQTPLNLAARHGHTEVVKVLLANGARVDHSDCDGWTALRASAWGGHTEVVELLLEAGAAVDSADSDQRTALRAAAWGGHEGIVEALLRAGADVNRTDDEGRTALIAAAYMGHAGIVEHLLNYGAHINHQDTDGRTALSVAALCVPANEGYVKVVNILLERGAEVDHEDKDGMTPLLVAAFEGHRDVCELLVESEADVDSADRGGRTPLWAAASMGHAAVVELLLFWGCGVDGIDAEGRTVLSVAAAQGDTTVVRLLLDRGLDEQHRDNSGWTPLHYAAFEGHRSVCEALLDAGARVDEPDNDGKGPLHLAAQEGHIALVQTLLTRYAAPPDQRAHDGKTPLRLAALEGQYEVLRALLLSGADVDAKDADGRSVLYILALENHLPMARFLLEHGGANVESRDSEGRTALHVSAWQGHLEMVALLLKVGGADVNAVDHENRTALHSAAWQGNAAIVRLLLEHAAKPDHTCNQGATALGIAAQEGHEVCVRALLEHGADPNHCDRCGRNAVRVAAKSGHDAVVRLLEEYAASVRSHQLRLPINGGSSSATSVTSGASVETKPSSAVLVPSVAPSAPMAHPNSSSPLESPDSTAKRRSFVSLGNHSSHSKSSSNLTGSTKSSQPDPNCPSSQVPSSFTQQLQQCSRLPKGRPHSRLLSPNLWEPQSPIYATPPHSPMSDVGRPYSPLTLASFGLDDTAGNLAEESQIAAPIFADPHFTRDTHMRIILGNTCSGVGQNAKSGLDNANSGRAKPRRNGIVTNPALRLMSSRKNGLEESSSRKSRLGKKGGPSGGADSGGAGRGAGGGADARAAGSSGGFGFHWRKETPL